MSVIHVIKNEPIPIQSGVIMYCLRGMTKFCEKNKNIFYKVLALGIINVVLYQSSQEQDYGVEKSSWQTT